MESVFTSPLTLSALEHPAVLRTAFLELKGAATRELTDILDWWAAHTVDTAYGGFIGRIDGFGVPDPTADKSVILNTRILWAFSAAAHTHPGQNTWRELADRAFHYLLNFFWDDTAGGLYWMVDYTGRPVQTKKQVYAQAFGIYAFIAYHRLTGNVQALEKALELVDLIEQYSFDPLHNGYLEAFDSNWHAIEDLRLSEKDTNAAKTMNTHLHILEAYAFFYKVAPNSRLKWALENLISLFLEKFIHRDSGHLQLFFDEVWQAIGSTVSYGHEIETSWLLAEAAENLGIQSIQTKVYNYAIQSADKVLREGMDVDGGLFNEAEYGQIKDANKDWWPQAEAVVGFLNAWYLTEKTYFALAALQSWHFIEGQIKDKQAGEWLWACDTAGLPDRKHDKVGPWKCPYHNTRACLEIIQRLS